MLSIFNSSRITLLCVSLTNQEFETAVTFAIYSGRILITNKNRFTDNQFNLLRDLSLELQVWYQSSLRFQTLNICPYRHPAQLQSIRTDNTDSHSTQDSNKRYRYEPENKIAMYSSFGISLNLWVNNICSLAVSYNLELFICASLNAGLPGLRTLENTKVIKTHKFNALLRACF